MREFGDFKVRSDRQRDPRTGHHRSVGTRIEGPEGTVFRLPQFPKRVTDVKPVEGGGVAVELDGGRRLKLLEPVDALVEAKRGVGPDELLEADVELETLLEAEFLREEPDELQETKRGCANCGAKLGKHSFSVPGRREHYCKKCANLAAAPTGASLQDAISGKWSHRVKAHLHEAGGASEAEMRARAASYPDHAGGIGSSKAEPIGKGKGRKYPPGFQHIRNALIRQGKSVGEASAIAYGALRRWAGGRGKVKRETRAKARKVLGELAGDKGRGKAKRVVTQESTHTGEEPMAQPEALVSAATVITEAGYTPAAEPEPVKAPARQVRLDLPPRQGQSRPTMLIEGTETEVGETRPPAVLVEMAFEDLKDEARILYARTVAPTGRGKTYIESAGRQELTGIVASLREAFRPSSDSATSDEGLTEAEVELSEAGRDKAKLRTQEYRPGRDKASARLLAEAAVVDRDLMPGPVQIAVPRPARPSGEVAGSARQLDPFGDADDRPDDTARLSGLETPQVGSSGVRRMREGAVDELATAVARAALREGMMGSLRQAHSMGYADEKVPRLHAQLATHRAMGKPETHPIVRALKQRIKALGASVTPTTQPLFIEGRNGFVSVPHAGNYSLAPDSKEHAQRRRFLAKHVGAVVHTRNISSMNGYQITRVGKHDVELKRFGKGPGSTIVGHHEILSVLPAMREADMSETDYGDGPPARRVKGYIADPPQTGLPPIPVRDLSGSERLAARGFPKHYVDSRSLSPGHDRDHFVRHHPTLPPPAAGDAFDRMHARETLSPAQHKHYKVARKGALRHDAAMRYARKHGGMREGDAAPFVEAGERHRDLAANGIRITGGERYSAGGPRHYHVEHGGKHIGTIANGVVGGKRGAHRMGRGKRPLSTHASVPEAAAEIARQAGIDFKVDPGKGKFERISGPTVAQAAIAAGKAARAKEPREKRPPGRKWKYTRYHGQVGGDDGYQHMVSDVSGRRATGLTHPEVLPTRLRMENEHRKRHGEPLLEARYSPFTGQRMPDVGRHHPGIESEYQPRGANDYGHMGPRQPRGVWGHWDNTRGGAYIGHTFKLGEHWHADHPGGRPTRHATHKEAVAALVKRSRRGRRG